MSERKSAEMIARTKGEEAVRRETRECGPGTASQTLYRDNARKVTGLPSPPYRRTEWAAKAALWRATSLPASSGPPPAAPTLPAEGTKGKRRQRRTPFGAGLVAVVSCILVFASALSGCGRERKPAPTWDRDPIVPGYSLADIDIGKPFSEVQAVHGDPDDHRKEGRYIYAYYGRLREGGGIDDPCSWRLVVTLYDQGNGYLDPGDEVGAVEVSAPYAGMTSGGIGMGSTAEEVEGEFGKCPNRSTTTGPEGEALTLYSYPERGVDFLVSDRRGVVTVVVTAYGGLRQLEDEEGDVRDREGVFGPYQGAPIVPGKTAAGVNLGDEFQVVKKMYGLPDASGFTTEGLVYATYTGGHGSWKLSLYFEDRDHNKALGDYDVVLSICVRAPYSGKTPKGVGIGSTQAQVIREFGKPERQTTLMHQGEQTSIMEYNAKGIVFATSALSGVVVEIDVNPPSS